jgi:hypothetical protein
MAINYGKMAATAKRLIGSNGTRCQLKNPVGEPEYDPANNDYIQNYDTFEGVCIISGYSDELIDGTVIKIGDRKVIAVLSGEPLPSLSKLDVYDKKGNLTESYQIINFQKISPDADTIIAFRLQCRR